MSILVIIGIILLGYCLVGGKFLERLFGAVFGAVIILTILIFILGKKIGIF